MAGWLAGCIFSLLSALISSISFALHSSHSSLSSLSSLLYIISTLPRFYVPLPYLPSLSSPFPGKTEPRLPSRPDGMHGTVECGRPGAGLAMLDQPPNIQILRCCRSRSQRLRAFRRNSNGAALGQHHKNLRNTTRIWIMPLLSRIPPGQHQIASAILPISCRHPAR